ncbi:MAG: succinate dehydrogenase/fumarate reductase flavoprotein subunit, partial [Rhizobiaceae bacterium]
KMATLRDPDEDVLAAEIARVQYPLSRKPAAIHELRQTLQDVMWDDVGVIRTGTGLRRGAARISEIQQELMQTGVAGDNLAFNLTWHDWLNMASLCDISQVITQAALTRHNSRGAHYREDFPNSGTMENSYFTVATQSGEALSVTREDVQFTIVKPGETILPDHEPETLVANP